MLLKALLLSHLTAALGSPFHKYPFSFLLDVGNEQLEKTSSEQLRVSLPGGSVALRHPAVGGGATIAHVRVAGVDYGADVKVSVVDGGPGYRYVVLAFVGKPDVAYDAVVTIRRLREELEDADAVRAHEDEAKGNSIETTPGYEEGDDIEVRPNRRQDIEPANSNVDYTKNEISRSLNIEHYPGEKYIRYGEELKRNENSNKPNENYDVKSGSYEGIEEETTPDTNPDELDESYDGEALSEANNNLYDSLVEPQPYSESSVYIRDGREQNQGDADYVDDPLEIDQMFNDEEVHKDPSDVRDPNDDTLNYATYESAVVES